jgi:hypothetical protein
LESQRSFHSRAPSFSSAVRGCACQCQASREAGRHARISVHQSPTPTERALARLVRELQVWATPPGLEPSAHLLS